MTPHSANDRSPQLIEMEALKPLAVHSMPEKPTFGGSHPPELIDSVELARRLNLPVSWVRSHTRQRTSDEIPTVRFGRYCRFDWNSLALQRWIAAHGERTRG